MKVLKNIKPFITILQILGIYPVIKNKGFSKICAYIYTIIIFLIDLVYLVYNFTLRPPVNELREWIFVFQNIFYASVCFISHTLFLYNSKKINSNFRKVIELFKDFESTKRSFLLIFTLEFLCGYLILTFMYSLTLFGTYLHYISKYKHMIKEAYGHLMHYFYTFLMYIIESTFINLILLIRFYFKNINKQLTTQIIEPYQMIKTTKQNVGNRKQLKYLIQLHCSLCEINNLINDAFSWQLIVSYLTIFVETSFSTYFIIITLINYGTDSIGVKLFSLYLIPWSIYHVVKLSVISIICDITAKEVSPL